MAKLRELLEFKSLRNLKLVYKYGMSGRQCGNSDCNGGTGRDPMAEGGRLFNNQACYSGDDEEKQCRLLYDLLETRSACLAIKTGKYTSHISDKMIEIADKNHFPLLQIPYEMTYIDIIMDVM